MSHGLAANSVYLYMHREKFGLSDIPIISHIMQLVCHGYTFISTVKINCVLCKEGAEAEETVEHGTTKHVVVEE